MEVLCESPLIMMIPNFLPEKLINSAKTYIEKNAKNFKSSVTEDEQGEVISRERISKSMVPNPNANFVRGIQEKCAELLGTEVERLEQLQVIILCSLSSLYL